MKTLLKYLNNIILCIRFPFLYPRNRFTDLHHTDWGLKDAAHVCYKNSRTLYTLNIVNESQLKGEKTKLINSVGITGRKIDDHIIKLSYKLEKPVAYDISVYTDAPVKKVVFVDRDKADCNAIYVVVEDGYDIKKHFIMGEFTVNKYLKYLSKILNWIHRYPVQLFHCFPTYTELDAMDKGWRKRFGIDICKDVKKSLLKNGGIKHLLKYRIMQIKEKFGRLRWYDENGTTEILSQIIPKYEELSYHTCISCGKPATKLTTGWICPYCDDCIGDRNWKDINMEDEEDENEW